MKSIESGSLVRTTLNFNFCERGDTRNQLSQCLFEFEEEMTTVTEVVVVAEVEVEDMVMDMDTLGLCTLTRKLISMF